MNTIFIFMAGFLLGCVIVTLIAATIMRAEF